MPKRSRELDRPFDQPLPSRDDATRLRTVLDLCVDQSEALACQLEALAWGGPSGEVRVVAPRLLLEAIAQDLVDGGEEGLTNPVGWHTAGAQPGCWRRSARGVIIPT